MRENAALEPALRQEPWFPLFPRERPPDTLRLVLEDPAGEAALADQPLNYSERRFGLRQVRYCAEAAPPPTETVGLEVPLTRS